MYAIKLELKLNNKERSRLAGCAGFARFVYNFGLDLLKSSWEFKDIKANDSKRLGAIEKIFTNCVKTNPNYSWMKEYPSAIYSSALRNDAQMLWVDGVKDCLKFPSLSQGSMEIVSLFLKRLGSIPQKGKKC